MKTSQFISLARSVVIDPHERERSRELTRRTARMRWFVADHLGQGEHSLQIYRPAPPIKVVIEDAEIQIADDSIDLEDVVEHVEQQAKVFAKIDLPEPSLDERASLKASIRKYGIIYPAVYDRWGWLLDGRLRKEIAATLSIPCPTVTLGELAPDDRRQLAIDLDLCRKQSSRKGRRTAAQVLLKRSPSTSNRQIARAIGVDHKTVGNIRNDMEAAGEIPHVEVREGEDGKTYRLPKIIAANEKQHQLAQRAAKVLPKSNNGKIMDVVTATRQARREKKRKKLTNAAIVAPAKEDNIQIHHCEFQKLTDIAGLEPNSAQLICTDIPYGKNFLPQLDELAKFADDLLVDGGLFVILAGQYYVNQVYATCDQRLNYRWTSRVEWAGDANIIHPLQIASQWKPILIYSKGEWQRRRQRIGDVYRVDEKDKTWHEWGQPNELFERLIRDFSEPGDLVIDPCGGGFTTAAACFNLGRRCISCDIDAEAVRSGQRRLAEMKEKGDN